MTLLGPYRAVSWRFEVRCEDDVLAEGLERALHPLATTAEDGARARYDVTAPRPGRDGVLTVDDEELVHSERRRTLYQTLLWHVNRGVVQASGDHVLVHAAAAERDGRAVLLCGQSEAGKTTLVAGLVRAGLRYLTDEATALRPADGGITPYPKSLSVDRGSWEVLADLRPDLPPRLEELTGEQWQVPPTALRADAVSAGARPTVLVLNRFVPGGPTSLRPVGRAEALVDVLQQTFEVQRRRRRDMTLLAEVLSGCDCYRLESGSLDGAVDAVLAALERAPA